MNHFDGAQIKQGKTTWWYIVTGQDGSYYLHYDGTWRVGALNNERAGTGWYADKEDAEAILEKYAPVPKYKVKELPEGTVFEYNDYEWMKLGGDNIISSELYVQSNNLAEREVTIVENPKTAYFKKWFGKKV